MPTNKEIELGMTNSGGFTKEQLATWGVPWPPPKGWKSDLIKKEKELRGGWMNLNHLTLSRRPNESGKRIKAMPRLDELDKWG